MSERLFQTRKGHGEGMNTKRNHEITKAQRLLSADGTLGECGWSRKPLQGYNRRDIRTPKFRIKEWDYYLVMAKDFGIAFTISDDGYIGLQSVSLIDLKRGVEHTETILNLFPMGKFKLPSNSSRGVTKYQDKRLTMSFLPKQGKRIIDCCFHKFWQNNKLTCHIELHQPKMDSLVIATPWKEKKTAFYYNQKINCMRAEGWIEYDGRRIQFDPRTDFGTLDWGRGVWTYDNTWYWGSGNCDVNGHSFGFNIGYGFGDTKAATENVLFYDGKAHKLDEVTFCIPRDSYISPWKFTSSDGRFEMNFEPVLDRAACLNALVVISDQHQVFGKMSGKAVLDDGTVITLDHCMCFAEKVHNRY